MNPRQTNRESVLHRYSEENTLSATDGLNLLRSDARVCAVVPAYQEEAFIGSTIESLGAVENPLEIVVVDNNSTDRTREIVLETARRIPWPVTLLTCLEKGPVHARKRGMDEIVAQYLKRDPAARYPYYIAMVDADTVVPKNWVRAILQTFADTGAGAVGGLHDSPARIDRMIEDGTGIQSFFCDLPKVAYWLTSHAYVQPQTKGANAAIEVASYAEIGGSRQPVDEAGKFVKGSDRLFGRSVRKIGQEVAFLPVITTSSPRRSLFSLFQKKNVAYYSLMEHWVDCRENEDLMVSELLTILSREEWLANMRDREYMYVWHSVLLPVLRKEMRTQSIAELVGIDHPLTAHVASALTSINIRHASSTIDTLAKELSRQFAEDLISAVHSKMTDGPRT